MVPHRVNEDLEQRWEGWTRGEQGWVWAGGSGRGC